mgnify:FL=1
MRYIIKESRLNNIIEKYLSSELGNLKLGKKDEDTDWYVNESGNPLVIINHGTFKGFLVLRRDIYDTLENMFGLDTTDDIQAHLRKYFYTKWGIDTDIIYTFEPGNESMV